MQNNTFNTLLIDGNSIFKRGYYGAKDMFNWKGEHVGGLYQFIVFLRNFLEEDHFKKAYVFWDGEHSSFLKRQYLPSYKMNRKAGSGFHDQRGLLTNEDLILERYKVKEYLEELSVRQFEYENVEADDLIGYYCINRSDNEVVTVCSADRDLLQLITDNVKVYLTDRRELYDRDSFYQEFGYIPENELLIKSIAGDTSDNIQGVKGVSRNTLFTHFPDLKNNNVDPYDLLEKIEEIQNERVENKKKRLKKLDKLRDFLNDENEYGINRKIINLSEPILTEECDNEIGDTIFLPLNMEDRSIRNFYEKLKRDGLDGTIDNRYVDFIIPFKELIEREKKNYLLNS